MECLVRYTATHESFRIAELETLASMTGSPVEVISYSQASPFCIMKFSSDAAVRAIVSRSMLAIAVYELWGKGSDYPSLHADLKRRSSHLFEQYRHCSFRFRVDNFNHSIPQSQLNPLFDSFRYMAFEGPILMKGADLEIGICEDHDPEVKEPKMIYVGRLISTSKRGEWISRYDLKKRKYISTTSMDSELALLTANLVRAAPGQLIYDPFSGTGSFLIACANFGAMTVGSDLDGRNIRGKKDRNVITNFKQYGLLSSYLDGFVSDFTNTPMRTGSWLDGIVCDPPYGIREGVKVLGSRNGPVDGPNMRDGQPAHLQPGYVPPKKQYSFHALVDDILDFAAGGLVTGGCLAFWMPTANEDEEELDIPTHPCLELKSVCVQRFNQWSRRLLTYQRMRDEDVDQARLMARKKHVVEAGQTADSLNPFRRKFFEGFKPKVSTSETPVDPESSRI